MLSNDRTSGREIIIKSCECACDVCVKNSCVFCVIRVREREKEKYTDIQLKLRRASLQCFITALLPSLFIFPRSFCPSKCAHTYAHYSSLSQFSIKSYSKILCRNLNKKSQPIDLNIIFSPLSLCVIFVINSRKENLLQSHTSSPLKK